MRDPDRVPVGNLPPFEDAALADAAARAGVYIPPDPINPNHYRQGPIECIDAMRACSTREEYEGHLRLTVIKYLWRLRNKGSALENAEKAQWYLSRLIESLERDE